jgi:hypothetical protein
MPVHSCLTPAKYQPWTKSGLVWKFKKKTKYKYQADRKISEKIQYQYQQVCSKDDTCTTLVNTILLMLKVPEQHMYMTVSLCCSNHSWVLFLVLFSCFIRVWVSSVSCLLIGCCYCQIWNMQNLQSFLLCLVGADTILVEFLCNHIDILYRIHIGITATWKSNEFIMCWWVLLKNKLQESQMQNKISGTVTL